jgi:eukaryotic-like serine/threonine-protein kinase
MSTTALDAPVAPAILEGAQLAPGYEVIEHLSRNQALDVYDVWDHARYCRCVAKTLRPDRIADGRATARLEQEGRLLAQFTHPHIVRAYETLHDPQLIVVLETLSGETLAAMIERRTNRLASREVSLLGLHLGSALRYMHREGYLHLDLKPSNVIIDQGLAKVLDLSLARPPGPGSPGVGTPLYLAPEQARGDPFDAATDVWGLGAVLFEAATGEPPFPDDTATKYPQLEVTATPIAHYRRLPRELAQTIEACLTPKRTGRPDIDELLTVLERVA